MTRGNIYWFYSVVDGSAEGAGGRERKWRKRGRNCEESNLLLYVRCASLVNTHTHMTSFVHNIAQHNTIYRGDIPQSNFTVCLMYHQSRRDRQPI